MTPAQKRRRDVLIILVGLAVVTLGLAVLVNPMLWLAHLLADAVIGIYVYLLVQLKRHGSLGLASTGSDPWSAPAAPPRSVALAHPRAPARPELAPLPDAAPLRQTAAR
jgi:hypothetical protein